MQADLLSFFCFQNRPGGRPYSKPCPTTELGPEESSLSCVKVVLIPPHQTQLLARCFHASAAHFGKLGNGLVGGALLKVVEPDIRPRSADSLACRYRWPRQASFDPGQSRVGRFVLFCVGCLLDAAFALRLLLIAFFIFPRYGCDRTVSTSIDGITRQFAAVVVFTPAEAT